MLRSQLLVYTCSDDEEDGGGGGGGGGAGGGGWVGGRERSLSQEIDSAMKKVLLPWERHSLERRGQNEMECLECLECGDEFLSENLTSLDWNIPPGMQVNIAVHETTLLFLFLHQILLIYCS